MVGKFMHPLKDLRIHRLRYIHAIVQAITRIRIISLGLQDLGPDLPGDGELSGQGIGLGVFRTWPVSQDEVKAAEEECLQGL